MGWPPTVCSRRTRTSPLLWRRHQPQACAASDVIAELQQTRLPIGWGHSIVAREKTVSTLLRWGGRGNNFYAAEAKLSVQHCDPAIEPGEILRERGVMGRSNFERTVASRTEQMLGCDGVMGWGPSSHLVR